MDTMLKKLFTLVLFLAVVQVAVCKKAASFNLQSRQSFTIACDTASEEKVVSIALKLLARDCKSVLSATPSLSAREGQIYVGTMGKSPVIQQLITEKLLSGTELQGKKEAFLIRTLPHNGKTVLVITGSDKRGTAYGILELSRLMGVSPWEWWADVTPHTLPAFTLEGDYQNMQAPSVEFRGIFINDEDWGLMPWSGKNYEPSDRKGHIGPKTHERIFELLLRLRANTLWPAMHECSLPFFLTPGNKEVAEAYSIHIGTSHCEPMLRNAAGEWSVEGKGAYDYVGNKESVYDFWEKRVKETAGGDNVYTIGMRGVHDGKMQGAQTIEEQRAVLDRVFVDQRKLLQQYVHSDVTQVPQAFIPYKEVQDIYDTGLQVPDDVTLIWCDDNYGYIRHFPTAAERARKGGNGVYYHVSYWGRPHDHLWLASTQPELVYEEMTRAYRSGIQKMWILNVGDIKPAEYLTEFFLDMAWNFEKVEKEGVSQHLSNWLCREFGAKQGKEILPVMQEYYRLAHIRKPEFMGNTREEERDPIYRVVKDLPWNEKEIKDRLASYQQIAGKAEKMAAKVSANRQDAYFELVKYPVQASAQMNQKILTAQLARHGMANWNESDAAYDSIVQLTRHYNQLENGKWSLMMDSKPRRLPVFEKVKRTEATTPLPAYVAPLYLFNGAEYTSASGAPAAIDGLGYEGKALELPEGQSISFRMKKLPADSIRIEIRLLPNHPVKGDKLRFSLSLDGKASSVIEYQTVGRSEEWKENVLRNQAIRRITLPVPSLSAHELKLTAIDPGVVVDQVIVYNASGK